MSDQIHRKIRGLRLLEARFLAVKKLKDWLAYGRSGGENEEVAFENENAILNLDLFAGLTQLGGSAEEARNAVRSTRADLVEEDARLAQAMPRLTFENLAREDAEIMTQAQAKASDQILNLEFPNPKLKSLRITMSRAYSIKDICCRIADGDNGETLSSSMKLKGLIQYRNYNMLCELVDSFTDSADALFATVGQLEKDYNEYAKSHDWESLREAAQHDSEAMLTVDDEISFKCANWSVEWQ